MIAKIKAFLNKPLAQGLVWLLAILAIWEIASRCGLVANYILPPFTKVLGTLAHEIVKGQLLIMIGRSLLRLIVAITISLLISTVIILLCLRFRSFKNFYNLLSNIMNAVPSMAILPLIIMWFGIDNTSIMLLVAHSVVWTFTIYVNEGIASLSKVYRDFADNIELSTTRRVRDVYLPALLPNIVSGLKVVWARAWRSLIGAEIVFGTIGRNGGLGYFINMNRLNGNMTKVIAGIIIIATIGLLVEAFVFRPILKKLKRWGMLND